MFNSVPGVANSELLQIAASVAKEKGINTDVVISALEQAIEVAARRKYGNTHNVRAEISRKNGEIILEKVLDVVDNVENSLREISLQDALLINPDVKVGGYVTEPLPPIDLGRVSAIYAKHIIVQKVKDAELDKQYQDFQGKIGEILNGVVKRIEHGNFIIDLGRAEAILRKDQVIRGEFFRVNDRVKCYVQDVRKEKYGPQIFLSRTDRKFLAKLLEMEVPEIYDNVIKIKAIARDPGSKAKVAVLASDVSIDAVGACVGVKGARIKSITNELNGEKIDVIQWSDDLAQMAINSLAPAEISKVIINQEKKTLEVIVSEDQLNLAIGRRGQNARLASQILGWHVKAFTEEQDAKRRSEEFNSNTSFLVNALDIEETMAQLLIVEGFAKVEYLAAAAIEDIASIEGFDSEIAQELKSRAIEYTNQENNAILVKLEDLGVEQDLLDTLYKFQLKEILLLAESGIKTLEDLAETKFSEFKSILPSSSISDEEIKRMLAKK